MFNFILLELAIVVSEVISKQIYQCFSQAAVITGCRWQLCPVPQL